MKMHSTPWCAAGSVQFAQGSAIAYGDATAAVWVPKLDWSVDAAGVR